MDRVPTARDCMSPNVFTLHPDQDVYEAIDILLHRKASGAPVVDDLRQLVGILTEKDCLRVLSNTSWGLLAQGFVRNFMSPVRKVIEAHQDLFAVAQIFLEGNFPSLPVLDNGKLVGRISRLDVLRGIQAMEHLIDGKKRLAEKELKLKQSPTSIDQLQIMMSRERPEHMAALMRMRRQDEDGT